MYTNHAKKFLSILLVLFMLISALPSAVFANVSSQATVIIENTTYISDEAPWTGKILDTTADITDGETVADVLTRVFAENSINAEGIESNYISSVNGLAAFDGGFMSGWMYTLNDWFSNVGIGEQTVEDGDTIVLAYTLDYGEDLGGSWSNNDKTLKGLSFSEGSLSPAFSSDTKNYTLAVDSETDLLITPTASNKNFQVHTNVGDKEYKRSQAIPVTFGTEITVKCGDPSWPSMNGGSYGTADSVPAETYTVTVVESPKLSGLAVTSQTIDQTFSPSTKTYTVSTPISASSVQITGAVSDTSYTVTINGENVPIDTSGKFQKDFARQYRGVNTANVVVSNGEATGTYLLLLSFTTSSSSSTPRMNDLYFYTSEDTDLAETEGLLSPAFTTSRSMYDLYLANTVDQIALMPDLSGVGSYLTVIDEKGASQTVTAYELSSFLSLKEGSNLYTLTVYTSAGAVGTIYRLNIIRYTKAIGTDATLSSLSAGSGASTYSLSPSFQSDIAEYSTEVTPGVNSVTLTACSKSDKATISQVAGGTLNPDGSITVALSGPLAQDSTQAVTIIVRAEDKLHTSQYTVTLSRKAVSDSPVYNKELAWSQFRGDPRLSSVVDSKTPRTADETNLLWSASLNTGWMNPMPITMGDYIYLTARTSDNKWVIQKRSISDGTIIRQTELAAACGYFSFLSYGEGKIFVPIVQGAIQAFDVNTLESLWVTKSVDYTTQFDAQTISPSIYYNGYVYIGLTNGNAKDGMYYCVSAKDYDPSKTNEIKDYTWTYTPPAKFVDQEGYYWSGGVVVGDKIIFGGEAGEIVSHDLTANTVYDTYECGEAIRSAIQYDNKTKSIFFTTKSGNIHKLKVNADGTFDDTSHKSTYLSPDITSSPVTYNGRVYVGNGGMGAMSSHKFSVLDASTLNIIYQIDMHTQSSPVISTAYATAENNHKIYIYAARYSTPDEIYCITDFEGNTTPTYTTIAVPTVKNYNTATLTIDNNGTIYYKNDSGWLYAYGNTNSTFTAPDVSNAIKNLPSASSLTLNDEVLLQRAAYRLNSLPSTEKDKVSSDDKAKLIALESKLAELKDTQAIKAKLISDIDALPEQVTLADRDTIDSMLAVYNSLSNENKADITNYDKLSNAKSAVNILVDNKTVSDMVAEIEALNVTVNYDSKSTIYTIYNHYNALTDVLKRRVTNADKIISLKNQVDAVVAEVDDLNNDIWTDINPLDITLKDKPAINALITRYEKLSETDKTYVNNYDDVLYAKKIIDELEKGSVIAEVFENIMGNPDANYIASGKTPDGANYTITFNGRDVTDSFDFNTEISFTSDNKAKINDLADDVLVISFAHNGKLPGKATIEISVDLKDGSYSLYYFNEQTGKAEFVQAVTVKDGKASFTITHCSDYFIAAGLKTVDQNNGQQDNGQDNPNTGDTNRLPIYLVIILSSAVLAVLTVRKRKLNKSI